MYVYIKLKGDELVHSTTDGKKHYGFKEIEKAKNAVCILRNMGAKYVFIYIFKICTDTYVCMYVCTYVCMQVDTYAVL